MAGRPEAAPGRRAGAAARGAARPTPDRPGAPGRRAAAGGSPAPGQVGLAVVAAAAVVAAVVALTGDGETYWICVPVALGAAATCSRPRSSALAVAVIVAAAAAAVRVDCPDPPALWVSLLVPLASAAVLHHVRTTLERDRDGLRDFALTDPLTGVANRRALLAAADHEIARHRRSERPFAVVMVDLDGF